MGFSEVLFKDLKEIVRGIQFTDFKKSDLFGEQIETCKAYTSAGNFVYVSYMVGEEEGRNSFVVQDQDSNLYRTNSFIDMYNTCGKLLYAQGRGLTIKATEKGKGDITV